MTERNIDWDARPRPPLNNHELTERVQKLEREMAAMKQWVKDLVSTEQTTDG